MSTSAPQNTHQTSGPETPAASAAFITPMIQTVHLTKRFPGIIANQNVSITVAAGAFHAIIGENGAGKSTLLNILYGKYKPDSGRVLLQGKDITDNLKGPSDAIALGIGLVSQHYALIPALTVLENIVLGSEPMSSYGRIDKMSATERISGLAERLGMASINLSSRADQLTIAAQQKVEILKALYRNARVLLLDEPTATLAPTDSEALFSLLHTLNQQGATILFVTHKLREVIANCSAISVLRAGQNGGDFITRETNENELLARMLGPRSSSPSPTMITAHTNHSEMAQERSSLQAAASPVLRLTGVHVESFRGESAVQNATLELYPGEILGVAGVDGSGQRELSEAIVGLRRVSGGQISIAAPDHNRMQDVAGYSVRHRQELGVAYIPEDRHRAAMITGFTIAENYMLGHETDNAWGGGPVLRTRMMRSIANQMILDYDVRVGERDSSAMASDLSGGNQQKLVVARALAGNPRIVVACQPTRGLDSGATEFVYSALKAATSRGLSVILFSLDLDEILELADRVTVMFNGAIAGTLSRNEATAERIGALMTGSSPPARESK